MGVRERYCYRHRKGAKSDALCLDKPGFPRGRLSPRFRARMSSLAASLPTSPTSHPLFAMHWLREKSSRSLAKSCDLVLYVAFLCGCIASAALPEHGFKKVNWPFRPLERPDPPLTCPALY